MLWQLDTWAGHWQLCLFYVQGVPVTAVQWGVWAGAGMAASEGGLVARLARRGYTALPPEVGLAALSTALEAILAAGGTRVSCGIRGAVGMSASFDWPKFLAGGHHLHSCQQRTVGVRL